MSHISHKVINENTEYLRTGHTALPGTNSTITVICQSLPGTNRSITIICQSLFDFDTGLYITIYRFKKYLETFHLPEVFLGTSKVGRVELCQKLSHNL